MIGPTGFNSSKKKRFCTSAAGQMMTVFVESFFVEVREAIWKLWHVILFEVIIMKNPTPPGAA